MTEEIQAKSEEWTTKTAIDCDTFWLQSFGTSNSILFATIPFTLAEKETEKWNRAKKLNVRYVRKNPDTAKTQNRVPKLKEETTQFSNTKGEGVEQKYS